MGKSHPQPGRRRHIVRFTTIAAFFSLAACSQAGTSAGTAGAGGSGADQPSQAGQTQDGGHPAQLLEAGVVVDVAATADASAEEARLSSGLSALDDLSASAFAKRFAAPAEAVPHYDRAAIAGLDRIQASSLKLSEPALATLDARGFVLDDDHGFPSFSYGYQTLYLEDLPLFVSADSILNAVHLSFDDILSALETAQLSLDLDALLSGMHQRLKAGVGAELGSQTVADADVFLAVARSLLAGSVVAPQAGASAQQVRDLVALATSAVGTKEVTLFGVRRDEDFSQFKPRGHYVDSKELQRYFRASMWLGRVDLRLLETQPDGTQLFRRQQFEIMLLFRELIDAALRPHFERIDRTVAAFVGEPDYMVLSEVDALAADLGIASLADATSIPDPTIAQAIVDGGYGAQRISSQIMMNGMPGGTLPLSRSFALLGQRYVIDSHVFSNVVFDRIRGPSPQRMLPDPLDVAFAALGNDRAGALLATELDDYEHVGYPAALAKMRLLVDDHSSDYWESSLYTLWLGALRQLSPTATTADESPGLFPVARTEAWQRRLLNGQLASWAELRHDTILYAKQSYTGGATCDFPDAYVEPYPEFFGAIAAYGEHGTALIDSLDLTAPSTLVGAIRDHFALVADVATRLRAMAEHERSGAELTPDMLSFINDAVVVQNICGGGYFESGWYKKLFFNPASALEPDPTIADVHTQPTDEDGALVGNVLHVGTGTPRLMVVVAEGCSGPRAYAGLASTYRQTVAADFERLDDATWATQWADAAEVPWMQDLVTGTPTPSIRAPDEP